METLFFSNDNNLSQGSFAKQQQWGDNSAERQSKWRKFKWRVNENMQGKDVKAASETNMFTGTCLPLLRIPWPLHGYQEEHFLRSTCPCEPKPIQFTEINVQNDITLKDIERGASLIWEGPITYLVFLTLSINFHKLMSVPYMFSIAGVFAVAPVSTDITIDHFPWYYMEYTGF